MARYGVCASMLERQVESRDFAPAGLDRCLPRQADEAAQASCGHQLTPRQTTEMIDWTVRICQERSNGVALRMLGGCFEENLTIGFQEKSR